jgi:hypothetical protein
VDGDNRVLLIVLTAENLLRLGDLDLGCERVDRLSQFCADVFALARPFDQDGQVGLPLRQARNLIAVLLEPAAALQDLLGFLLILPEVRRRGPGVELQQFVGRM